MLSTSSLLFQGTCSDSSSQQLSTQLLLSLQYQQTQGYILLYSALNGSGLCSPHFSLPSKSGELTCTLLSMKIVPFRQGLKAGELLALHPRVICRAAEGNWAALTGSVFTPLDAMPPNSTLQSGTWAAQKESKTTLLILQSHRFPIHRFNQLRIENIWKIFCTCADFFSVFSP